MPHNLISAQENPVPLPTFQRAPRFKFLMSPGSKKGTQIYYPFHSKSYGKRIPFRFPIGERYLLIGHFYVSLNLSLFIFPSESPVREPPPSSQGAPSKFPNRVPMDRDTLSPEPLVCLFIHSCMSAGVPKKEPTCIWGKT